MDELEKKDRYNKLLFIYGNLLTENRLEKIESYFALDLSLSEIAEEDGVSRNAVHLSIKEAIKELEYYESKLHLLERRERIEKLLEDDKSIDEIKEQCWESGDFREGGIINGSIKHIGKKENRGFSECSVRILRGRRHEAWTYSGDCKAVHGFRKQG